MQTFTRQPSLVDQVANHLREGFLRQALPGTRLVSVRNLASALGVSVLTVRSAQEKLTREGLLEIRHGSGVYVAAHSVPSRWIGIYTALDILSPRTSSFHTLMPRALRQFLRSHGFRAEIYLGDVQPDEKEEGPGNLRFCADVDEGRLQGLVIVNAPVTDGWDAWVDALRIPAVGSCTPYWVAPAYDDMVCQSVRHLYKEGCRRIALLSWSNTALKKPLCETLAELGLNYHPEWTRSDLHPMHSGAGWEEFREIWADSREKPDGLVVTDDVLFDEVQIAIQEIGIRVPDQLRIVAYANKGSDKRYPFPVTVAQADPEHFAEALGGMLLKRMRGEQVVPSSELVPLEFAETDQVAASVNPRLVPHAVVEREKIVLSS